MERSGFVVLVPVKPPARGKSRLVGVPDRDRVRLAEAFARDTVAAATTCPDVDAVVVVTDDATLAASLAGEQCLVIPDGVSGDLNATLRLAAAEAYRRWPHLRPVALCADLPALSPGVLSQALRQAAGHTGAGSVFVPDRAGTGTTLYTAAYDDFRPRFGPDSAARHAAAGALRLTDVDERVRHDVDSPADLLGAQALGVGAHTARALAVSGR